MAPTVRADFAQRLRRLRTARGYRRARHLAEALGIDENRYTRYERAETEPDISLLTAICRTLALSPNELLGFDPRGQLALPPGTGFAGAFAPGMHEAGGDEMTGEPGALAGPPVGALVDPGSIGLWKLADCAVRHLPEYGATAGIPELARIALVAAVYAALKADPLGGLGRIAGEAARADLPVAAKAEVESLIGRLLAGLTENSR